MQLTGITGGGGGSDKQRELVLQGRWSKERSHLNPG